MDNVTPTYYGLGNHDYDNNVDDCLLNLCAERSLKFLEASFSKWQVEDKDVIRRNDGVWQGSYGYSKTVGAITFIQLNNHYNYSRRFTSGTNTHYEITPSLDWLEKQLVKAQANGKFIVINLHRPPADSTYGSEADRERFYQLVNAFKVLAIFHGHTHEAARRASIGVTPVYDSGASFKQTFLVSELDEGANAFTTFLARNNTVGSTPLDKVDIRLLPPLPTFSFQNQPGGGAIVATLAYDNTPRSFHLPIIELSIDGGAFKRYTPSNNVILMYDLKPRTTYTYKTRLYLAAGGNPIRVDDGSFETPAIESPPTDLCVNFFDAIDGWFELKWKPPTPPFTMPYAIQVEANEPAHATWVVRSIGEFRQTTTQVVRYEEKGRNPFNMSYSVFYWSPTLGYSATATLKGEDLLKSGCQY
ncbi:hypothetical protein KU43P_27480 [Pseudomonas sp. KU43P]|nr:hypothetical protein KU43P_27480 [Pseudomonas sp. KU43P]